MEQPVKSSIQLQNIDIPKLYANGFMIGLTLSDLNVTLVINGKPSHQLIMSLISAKTLMNGLKNAIEDFESKSGTTIPDMNELKDLFNKKEAK
jgi:hypothetical protein